MPEPLQIRPQGGPQEKFLSSPADIAIYGGAAGAGKTWAELIEPLRHIQTTKGFGAVIFRRTSPQIRNQGGLWDASATLYPLLKASPKESTTEWAFPPFGNRIKFTHLEQEKHIHDHQGAEYPLICFDELTHFSRAQFFYLLSRNRSTCGVAPYTRATTNPDPDSWVREFIDWWIGPDGLPIPEHSGELRWFYRLNDDLIWANTKEELTALYGEQFLNPETGEIIPPLSVTFVAASIYDNKELLRKDPSYLAKLKSLPRVERERLLGGNWNVRAAAGDVFPRECFGIVDVMPAGVTRTVRGWDFAGTKDAGDWTAGIKVSKCTDGYWYVEHATRGQWDSNTVRTNLRNTAEQDGKTVTVRIPQDPGQAGKDQAQSLVKLLAGFVAKAVRPTGSKYDRAQPAAAQVQAGNVKLVRGKWNQAFLDELENFSGKDGETDDQVDAFADAFNEIEGTHVARPNLRVL
jgi:predicted phage terminase large subunit-like protein